MTVNSKVSCNSPFDLKPYIANLMQIKDIRRSLVNLKSMGSFRNFHYWSFDFYTILLMASSLFNELNLLKFLILIF